MALNYANSLVFLIVILLYVTGKPDVQAAACFVLQTWQGCLLIRGSSLPVPIALKIHSKLLLREQPYFLNLGFVPSNEAII